MSASMASTNSADAGLSSFSADVGGSVTLVSDDDSFGDDPPLEHADSTNANTVARAKNRESRNFVMPHPRRRKVSDERGLHVRSDGRIIRSRSDTSLHLIDRRAHAFESVRPLLAVIPDSSATIVLS